MDRKLPPTSDADPSPRGEKDASNERPVSIWMVFSFTTFVSIVAVLVRGQGNRIELGPVGLLFLIVLGGSAGVAVYRRRRFYRQFSLATLFIFMTLVAASFAIAGSANRRGVEILHVAFAASFAFACVAALIVGIDSAAQGGRMEPMAWTRRSAFAAKWAGNLAVIGLLVVWGSAVIYFILTGGR